MYLRAYADESGTHDDAKHLMIAGHVSSITKWKRFDREWMSALGAVGIDVVISKDLVKAQGMFRGWPDEKLRLLGDGMQNACERVGGFGLTTRLDYADYEELYACEPSPKKARLDSAYGLCFRNWLWTIQNHAVDLYAKHPNAPKGLYVVLEDGAANSGDAARVFKEMQRKRGQKIPLLGFALGTKKMPGIQLAGIEAHRTWRKEKEEPEFKASPEGRPPLSEVRAENKEPMVIFRQKVDREFLTKWKAELLDIAGAKPSKAED